MKRILQTLLIILLPLFTVAQSITDLKQNYQKAIDTDDKNNAIFYLNKIAYYQWENEKVPEAIESFNTLYKLAESNGNKNAMRSVCMNLGMIYSDKSQYKKAEEYIQKSLQINIQMGDKAGQAAALTNLATAQQNQNDNNTALKSAEKALALAKELNNIALIRTCYGLLSEIHKKLGNSEKFSEYFNLYASFDQHIKREQMTQVQRESKEKVREAESQKSMKEKELRDKEQILEKTQASLEVAEQLTEKQKYQLELQEFKRKESEEKAAAELRRQTMIRDFMIVVILLILGFSGLLYRQIKKTKKANILLKNKNNEIRSQKDEIEKQSEKIKASIQYARRIQTAVLPPDEYLDRILPDHFVFFQPRDIVSGDFYWLTEKGSKTIVAVADCTGHGVPGAFMSMLGTAFLNEIINKIVENKHISELQAGEILTELRKYIMNSLHQKGEANDAKDGMDIVLIIIDHKEQKIQYAGANNALFVVHDGELIVYEPDAMPISYQREMTDRFATKEFKYTTNDTLYLCTDGYVDQFGGEKGRKFMVKRFKKMLVEINKMSMRKQGQTLKKTIEAWKGDTFQVDDMLIMGIRLIPTLPSKEVSEEDDWSDKTILIADDQEANYLYMT
ncbi:MAG: SpoIIE family protein phosphatase, partial [Salinivirgaceae bacterium]|nr:SpoIIE family protein phosphatase [Salinivirgaceae bacterium]